MRKPRYGWLYGNEVRPLWWAFLNWLRRSDAATPERLAEAEALIRRRVTEREGCDCRNPDCAYKNGSRTGES